MKILVLISNLPPVAGGAQQVAWQVAKHLATRDHEVSILSFGESDTKKIVENVTLYTLPEKKKPFRYYLTYGKKRIKEIYNQIKPDIINEHMPGVLGCVLIKEDSKFISTIHDGVPEHIQISKMSFFEKLKFRFIRKRIYSNSSALTTVSKHNCEYMNNRYKNKYVFDYIRSGVDTSFFKPLGFEKKNNIVLYVGRLIERKGISKIIELSKLLPDIHFNFIGSGALASKIVGSNIRCLGFVDDMNKHYNEADVCLFPSASENLPLVGLESLSCGTPVISTHMGFEEYINHNENGIIIDNTDLENMKSAILEVLSNTNLRNRIIDNGLKTAKAFDWNNMILGYEKKLLNVLKNA